MDLFIVITTSPLIRAFFEEMQEQQDQAHGRPCSFLFCDSLAEALTKVESYTLDGWIVDEKIDKQEGIEQFCASIRRDEQQLCLPILIITQQLKNKVIHQYLQSGASDFLTEPLSQELFWLRFEIAKGNALTRTKISHLSTMIQDAHLLTEEIIDHHSIVHGEVFASLQQAGREHSEITLLLIQHDPLPKSMQEQVITTTRIKLEQLLRESIRQKDLLFTPKKGQFLVVMPKTSARAAQYIAENLQETCKNDSNLLACDTRLTLSIGLVSCNHNHSEQRLSTPDHILQQLRTCLEQAQKKGDRIVSLTSHKP